jgi:hypothetical protein
MPQKKGMTKSERATRVSVKKEMAKPRMAKSAKMMELNLDATQIRLNRIA